MKKYKFWALALVVSSVHMSCHKDEAFDNLGSNEFRAVLESSSVTRTLLSEDNSILWSESDEISVFSKSTQNLV